MVDPKNLSVSFGTLASASLLVIALSLISGCIFIKTGMSDEERQKIAAPDKEIIAYVQKVSNMAASYVNHYDTLGYQEGQKISPCMIERARAIGVLNPEKVRIVNQTNLPKPSDALTLELYKKIGVDKDSVGALTLGHSIYIKPKYYQSYNILLHEFVHVMQMERLGVKKYVEDYIVQSLSLDYYKVPLEAEAFEKSAIIATSNIRKCKQLYEE